MADGKKPFQFNGGHQDRNRKANGQANQPPSPQPTPEQMLRMRAIARMEILPPYQSTTPHEMVFVEGGKETVKSFKGFTKREVLVAQFVAAHVQKEGMPILDDDAKHIARMALNLSEAVLQTISAQRGKDVNQLMEQIQLEDAQAAAETTQPTSID